MDLSAHAAILGVATVLAGCATTVAPASAPSPGVRIVEAAYAATADRDLDAFAALLDPQVEWSLAESDGLPYTVDNPIVGPDALIAKLGEVGQVLAFTHQIDEIIDAGDVIVVTGVYHGTYRPTDAAFTTPFVHIWRVSDGKVVRFRQFIDAAPVLAVMAPAG